MAYTDSSNALTLSNVTYPWRTDTDDMPTNLILTVINPELAVLCWEEDKHGNQTLLLVSNDHTSVPLISLSSSFDLMRDMKILCYIEWLSRLPLPLQKCSLGFIFASNFQAAICDLLAAVSHWYSPGYCRLWNRDTGFENQGKKTFSHNIAPESLSVTQIGDTDTSIDDLNTTTTGVGTLGVTACYQDADDFTGSPPSSVYSRMLTQLSQQAIARCIT